MAMFRTYTETFDMNTEQSCPTLIGIHTPIGTTPYRFLSPCFRMYKKFKYLGCDVTVVNAARLPVDPEQLGAIGGQNYIDPRDVLNPILFKGCHGESLGSILDSMYGGLLTTNGFHSASLDKERFGSDLQRFYYTALGDDSWRKSSIQKTLSIKGLHPLVYQVATPHQILPTNGLEFANYRTNNPVAVTNPTSTILGNNAGAENGEDVGSTPSGNGSSSFWELPTSVYNPDADTYGYYQGMNPLMTNKMSRLGWMDTLQFIGQNVDPANPGTFTREMVTQLGKLFMGLLLLPPANLCRQYLRVIIKHKFKFAGYRTITTGGMDEQDWDPRVQTWGYANLYTGNIPDSGAKLEPIVDTSPMVTDPEKEPLEDDEIDG